MTNRWWRRLLFGLSLVATSCAAPAALLPLPMPSSWSGPDEFRAPPAVFAPGTIVAWLQTCVSDKGTREAKISHTGVRRTLRGQTEVRMDVDSRRIGDLIVDDAGTVVDVRLEREFDSLGPILELVFEQQAWQRQALRRGQPVQRTVSLESMFRKLFEQSGIQVVEISIAPLEVSVEYVGQTDLLERRAAGYRFQGRVTNGRLLLKQGTQQVTASVEFVLDGFQYVDVSRGLELATERSTQTYVQVGRERQTERQRCQTHLNGQASRGI